MKFRGENFSMGLSVPPRPGLEDGRGSSFHYHSHMAGIGSSFSTRIFDMLVTEKKSRYKATEGRRDAVGFSKSARHARE